MSWISTLVRLCAALGVALCAAVPAQAAGKDRIFSYDAVNQAAQILAPGGLTFVFRKSTIGGTRVRQVLSTQEKGAASLTPAPEKELGPGGIEGLVGHKVDEHDLYEVAKEGQGAPLIRATCPGSDRAWLAFGSLRSDRELIIHAFGRNAASGKLHLCASLEFSWHGEWKLPEK
jgi:hypothetical protein